MTSPYATTFYPPERGRRARLALGLPICLLAAGASLVPGWLLLAPHQVQVTIASGELDVIAGAPPFLSEQRVPLSDLVSVRQVQLRDGRRVAGTAMPGYCVGRFSYPDLGPVWQATACQSEGVLLEVRGRERPLLLAPEPRGPFILALSTSGRFTAEPVRPAPAPGVG